MYVYLDICSTAVFAFEGIGLVSVMTFSVEEVVAKRDLQVIPITDAMQEPRKFPKVLSGVMLFLMGTLVLKHQNFLF